MYKIIPSIILFHLLSHSISISRINETTHISSELLEQNERVWLKSNWKYRSGDNFEWKEPDFNDSGWVEIDTRLIDTTMNKIDWKGLGWFRLQVNIDSSYVNKPLGMSFYQTGTAEIYLNGSKLFQTGKITSNPRDSNSVREFPVAFVFSKEKNNVISVRYSNKDLDIENAVGLMVGFSLEVGILSKMMNATSDFLRTNLLKKTIFIVAPLILALLHFFLFLFNTKLRQDLYYTIFLIFFAFYIYFIYSTIYTLSIENLLIYRELSILGLNFTLLFGSATIYSLYKPLPRYFYLFIFVAVVISFLAFLKIGNFIWYVTYAFIIGVSIWGSFPLFDSSVKKEGENIIKSGFVIMTLTGFLQIFVSLDVIPPMLGLGDIFTFGVLAFMIFMSVSLAYDFTLVNRRLEKQIAEINTLSEKTLKQELEAKDLANQRKILEIENKRKTQELEDARKLQLSMLPEKIPELPNYDIAVFMRTATEVGGDYYDFNLTDEGTLNAVIGDATGHGMKAGLMVTTIKSLFTSIGSNLTLTDFFEKCTVTIKEMNLGNLFMSLTFLKLKNENIIFSAAGMPPIYHYNSRKKSLDEIVIKSMPLGAVKGFPYQISSLEFEKNDMVVVMSDGLPERFNDGREMLGLHKVKERIVKLSEDHSAEEIIKELYDFSEEWSNGRALDDDLTLVVIKKL